MHTMQTTSMKQISNVGHDRNLQKGSDVQYVKNEEKRVITTVEQTAALKHGDIDQGQVTRMDHYGKPLNGDVSNMLPDEIQVLVFQHNILLK